MPHRRDIDGLRGLAVLAVVLFHAELPGFEGGFVGVDVFFVLSGYLIADIVTRDLDGARFRIRDFYVRRIRRIVPALAVVLLATLAVGSVVLLPSALERLGRSAVSAAAMVSNVDFWQTTGGYFDRSSEVEPLLHTWSLGVEEQFYLAFPIAMVLLARFVPRRWWGAVAVTLTVLALVGTVVLTPSSPRALFYLPVGRAWQLLAGVSIALAARPAARLWPRELAGVTGLVLVLIAIVGFDGGTVYPGVASIVPTVGTALLLWAGLLEDGTGTRVGRALATRGLVGLGLVSYSWYLWHWPALVFWRESSVTGSRAGTTTALVLVASLVLAVASWAWVEQPGRRWRPQPRGAFAFAAAAFVLLAAGGGLLWRSGGLPERVPSQVAALERTLLDARGAGMVACVDEDLGTTGICEHPDGAGPVRIAVWGDSHGSALLPTVADLAAEQGHRVLGMVRPACPPVLDVRVQLDGDGGEPCAQFGAAALDEVLGRSEITDVVLVARWGVYVERLDPVTVGGHVDVLGPDGLPAATADRGALVGQGLQALVDRLEADGRRVHLVYPVPTFTFDVPRAAAQLVRWGDVPDLARSVDEVVDAQASTLEVLDAVRLATDGRRLYPVDALCDELRCVATGAEGEVLYLDEDHLSDAGARLLRPQLTGALALAFDPDETVGG